jgi:hypothetical protein
MLGGGFRHYYIQIQVYVCMYVYIYICVCVYIYIYCIHTACIAHSGRMIRETFRANLSLTIW